MSTNEQLRQRARLLIKQGVAQKIIADRMGVSESQFSRWVHAKAGSTARISVDALDGFEVYVRELSAALLPEERKQGEGPSTGTARSIREQPPRRRRGGRS